MINFKFFEKKIFIKFCITSSIISLSFFNLGSLANNSKEISTNNYKTVSEPYVSEYILGAGDNLFIEFVGIQVYSGNYLVNNDGYIFLPEIDYFYVKGKNIKEIKKELTEIYKNYIFDPDINLFMTEYRPVTIYLSGSVRRPGLYTLKYSSNSTRSNEYPSNFQANSTFPNKFSKSYVPPKLFDFLKLGKGFTPNADLSEITIIRNNSLGQGGGKIKASINLLDLIETGNQEINIEIRDGDSIKINKGDKNFNEQIASLNQTNLSPETINVYISGNVESTGRIQLNQDTTLTQAIASAGGLKSMSGKIEFLRFKSNGNIEKRKFTFNSNSKRNSNNNPTLIEGDIINVTRSPLGNTTEVIKNITLPIITSYSIYSIFE